MLQSAIASRLDKNLKVRSWQKRSADTACFGEQEDMEFEIQLKINS